MLARRSLLALLAAIAGCSGTPNPAPETPTLTPAPTPTPVSSAETRTRTGTLADGLTTENGETRLTARLGGVRQSFFYEAGDEAYAVAGGRNERYLFVALSSEGPTPPEVSDFQLRLGGETFHATRDPGHYTQTASWWRLDDLGHPYSESQGGGWVAFPVHPDERSGGGRFTWLGEEGWRAWPLSPETVARLNEPIPPFEQHVDLPTRIASDEPLSVHVEATNHGRDAGTFRAAVNLRYRAADRDRPSHDAVRGTRTLDPNETWTWEFTYTDHIATGTEEVTVEVATADRTAQQSVTVRQ